MTGAAVDGASMPALGRGFRLQWEAAQSAYVLLFPEGMIRLNASAGEILKRCDGRTPIGAIVDDLELVFAATGLADEVTSFIDQAAGKGWLTLAR